MTYHPLPHRFHRTWFAVKWRARFLIAGGQEVLIPCIMPSPTFSAQSPGFRPVVADERMGEPAVKAALIGIALACGVSGGYITDGQRRTIENGARFQALIDIEGEKENALKNRGFRYDPPVGDDEPDAAERTRIIRRASRLCLRLEDPMREWRVVT